MALWSAVSNHISSYEQEDPGLEYGAAGAAGALSVVGLTAAVTHDTPAAALFGSAVAAHGGIPKVGILSLEAAESYCSRR